MAGMLVNVRRLLAGYRTRELLVRIAEEYLWWIIRSWPGFEGVALRYLFLKCTTAELAGFCWISQGCSIANSYGLKIGKNFATNRNVLIDAIGGIEIGDNVGIGPNTVIISQEHSMLSQEGYLVEECYRRKPIKLGDDSWIGANCFIKAGVTIGARAVVGACSNVIADVPENGRVIGSPARPYTEALREWLRAEREAKSQAKGEGSPQASRSEWR
jgi:acetyltransferase-like isoleucine patch superfamily enzyme